MMVLAWIVVTMLATLAFLAVVDRAPPAWSIVLFVTGVPLSIALRSTGGDQASMFSLIKMAAVGAGAVYIQSAKVTGVTEHRAGRALGFTILAGNILEAVVAEIMQGGWLNAAAGLLLVLTQAGPNAIDRARGAREFRYRLGALWVAGYVLWNFTFVFGRNSHGLHATYAAMAIVHLGAPLLAMRGRSELFMQYRGFALYALMVLRLVAPQPPFLMHSSHWYSPAIAAALSAASFVLAAVLAAQAVMRARATRVANDALGWAALPRS